MAPERLPQQGWTLHFYDFRRSWAPVEDLVPGAGDVLDRARRNGAVDGTPFFIDPTGRADPVVNAFWRAPKPGAMGLKIDTVRRYAYALLVWLNFLHSTGSRWDRAGRGDLGMFKQWRLSTTENPGVIAPSSFHIDRAAIRRFYDWATERVDVDNPVRLRSVGPVLDGVAARQVLEGTPSAIRRANVKWLTPDAFRLWRNLGLRGFNLDGVPVESWAGLTEDRDVAFAEGLFGTGLRLGEWSSVLTVELTGAHRHDMIRAQLSAACTKSKVGRRFWIRRRVVQMLRYYVDDGGRPAAIARAQAAGRYEGVRERWLLRQVRHGEVIQVVDPRGLVREVHLDALGSAERMRLFLEGENGLEPVWLWLNHDGTPRPKKAWYKTFDRANARVARAMATAHQPARLWCRPHMLRHSFALRWYCVATFVGWSRTKTMTPTEQREFRNQLGDAWYLVATLLGHASTEVTRSVYLEPFQGLQIEHLIALMDSDDRRALEQLVDLMALEQPQVLTGALA